MKQEETLPTKPDLMEELEVHGQDEHGFNVEVGIPCISLRNYFAGVMAPRVPLLVNRAHWAKDVFECADALITEGAATS